MTNKKIYSAKKGFSELKSLCNIEFIEAFTFKPGNKEKHFIIHIKDS